MICTSQSQLVALFDDAFRQRFDRFAQPRVSRIAIEARVPQLIQRQLWEAERQRELLQR